MIRVRLSHRLNSRRPAFKYARPPLTPNHPKHTIFHPSGTNVSNGSAPTRTHSTGGVFSSWFRCGMKAFGKKNTRCNTAYAPAIPPVSIRISPDYLETSLAEQQSDKGLFGPMRHPSGELQLRCVCVNYAPRLIENRQVPRLFPARGELTVLNVIDMGSSVVS